MLRMLAVLFVLSLLYVTVAFAGDLKEAEQPGERVRPGAEGSTGDSSAQMSERLFQQLGVDGATRTRLVQRLQPLHEWSEALHNQRRAAVENLQELVRGLRDGDIAMDSAALQEALGPLYAVDDALQVVRGERSRVFREILSPEQQLVLVMLRLKARRERMQDQRLEPEGGNGDEQRYAPWGLLKQVQLQLQ